MAGETIFVADGGRLGAPLDHNGRARKQREVGAYLYSGWEFVGWGSAPGNSALKGLTGFWIERRKGEGPGFGPEALVARLASGLHTAIEV